jgi:hypothetical protein
MMQATLTHPLYTYALEDWTLMRDCYKGEKQVKSKGEVYLPATSGHQIDGMLSGQLGKEAYDSYKKRAVYHNFPYDAVESYIGLLHYKPTQINLPKEMEFLRSKATINGDSLSYLLRRIHAQQLITGRVGLLADIDSSGSGMPYIAVYHAENIVNWDEGSDNVGMNALNLIVLDETEWVRNNGLGWSEEVKYRVLSLGDVFANEEDRQSSIYSQSILLGNVDTATPSDFITPKYRGQTLNEIPFVFVNSKDVLATPDTPPLLGLANLSLAIYRAEADYRHTLYMQGQDTLVVIGGVNHGEDSATRVGAGAKIDVDPGGDAKFIGVSSSGLAEMRQAIANDKEAAVGKAGQLMNSNSKQESGDALKIRMAAQTANLNQVAVTAAYALEELLKKVARWMNLDDSQVVVIPNLQFSDKDMRGQDFAQLIAAKNTGLLPLADESVHNILKEQGYTKLTYEEERKLMKKNVLEPPIKPETTSGDVGVQQPTASMAVDRVTVNNKPING